MLLIIAASFMSSCKWRFLSYLKIKKLGGRKIKFGGFNRNKDQHGLKMDSSEAYLHSSCFIKIHEGSK